VVARSPRTDRAAIVHYRSRRSSPHYGKLPILFFGTYRIATRLERLDLNLCTLRELLRNKILTIRRSKEEHRPPLRKHRNSHPKKNLNEDSTTVGCSYR
jgi:hypothetical protein